MNIREGAEVVEKDKDGPLRILTTFCCEYIYKEKSSIYCTIVR